MPYLAKLDDNSIIRACEIKSDNKDKDLECPYCGDVLGYRKEAVRDDGTIKSRAHFWHYERTNKNNSRSCSSINESEEHKLMKQQIVKRLHKINDDMFSGEIHLEKKVGENIADVVYEFEEPINKGKHQSASFRDKTNSTRQRGIIFEVQYKNKSKNYVDVTKNSLKHGYSIKWVFHSDYARENLTAKNKLHKYITETVDFSIYEDDSITWGDSIYYNNFKYVIKNIDELYPLNPDSNYKSKTGTWFLGTFKTKNNLSKSYISAYSFLNELFSDAVIDYIHYSDRKGGGSLKREEINNMMQSKNKEIIRLCPVETRPSLAK